MRIIRALIDFSVVTTIFVTGLWLRGNRPALALLQGHSELFALENHGEMHLPPVLGSRRVYGLPVAGTLEVVRREVDRGADLVTAAGAARPKWYRGAAGLYSPAALALIQDMGFSVAGFSLNGDQGASLPAASVARRIGSAVSGDVIISHVNQPRRESGAGVVEGVAALRRAGVVFAPLDALPVTRLTCQRAGGGELLA